MSEFESINNARKQLMESLGEKDKQYLDLMKLWFRMKLTKEDFDNECKKFLNDEQVHLHNQLLLNLISECYSLGLPPDLSIAESSLPRQTSTTGSSRYPEFDALFEPLDGCMYSVSERGDVKGERGELMQDERLLPDRSVAHARIVYTAWELGLDGCAPSTPDLLVVAVHQFLKNIITAVISRRKGCKLDGKFVHGVGEPIPNPWLNNVANRANKKFHSLKCDPKEEGILVPVERPSREWLEKECAFKLASSNCDYPPPEHTTLPITLYDLVMTLKIYPSLVASHFVYTVNCERIWARINHPSWEH